MYSDMQYTELGHVPCPVATGVGREDSSKTEDLVLKASCLGGSVFSNFIGQECLNKHWLKFPLERF